MTASDGPAAVVSYDDLVASLPPEWPDDPFPGIRRIVRARREKIVVLDDDPTGTQTVHGLPILTRWDAAALAEELENDLPSVYLLTNSRGMAAAQAARVNREIGGLLRLAGQGTDRRLIVASRSDSTLRGHFPGEVHAIAEGLGETFDAWLLIPFFLEGGRVTARDVHYVREGDRLVPAGQTEFARDPAFAYRASDLREWVQEKTAGAVAARDVASVSIDDLRLGGPEHVAGKLAGLTGGRICIVNGVTYRDMEVFTAGLLQAEAAGQRFLYRTSASFLRVRAGVPPAPLLTRPDLALEETGGALFFVGSYVPRTTAQLSHLLERGGVAGVEVGVERLLSDHEREDEIARAAAAADSTLRAGQDTVVYTSRDLVAVDDPDENLAIGRRVSSGLVAIARAITTRPRYLLAKGGATASDIATEALAVRRATALGQILPGVPVWKLGQESLQADLPFIVFPGNVGDASALTDVLTALAPQH
ncbi:MAG: four-carbon acid sugar kinase family protein [Dehalococcoidia bacterium]